MNKYAMRPQGWLEGFAAPLKYTETAYLLKSETMKRRLLEAKERHEALSIEVAIEKLGI